MVVMVMGKHVEKHMSFKMIHGTTPMFWHYFPFNKKHMGLVDVA